MCSKSIIRDCAKNFVTNLLFSTIISGYPAGYPVNAVYRISGINNQPDIRYPAKKVSGPTLPCTNIYLHPRPLMVQLLGPDDYGIAEAVMAFLLPKKTLNTTA